MIKPERLSAVPSVAQAPVDQASSVEAPAVHDPFEFRRALGRFATGVCIATTQDSDGEPVGLTINSFASVSLDPPLVLWSIGRKSQSAAAFTGARRFNLAVLGASQESVSHHFARPQADRFTTVGHWFDSDEHGLPMLGQALARFSCELHQVVEAGDHLILIGRVDRFDAPGHPQEPPLVYQSGRYRHLQTPAAVPEPPSA